MAKKMNKGAVALSSAAILSVYGIGYVLTQPAAGAMAAGQVAAAAPATAAASGSDSTAGRPARSSVGAPSPGQATQPGSAVQSGQASQPGSAGQAGQASPLGQMARPAAAATAAQTSGLKDGTYTGSGMSRHGGVNVKVVVQNGKIVSAAITSVSTRYSQNVIAALPGQVLAAQGAHINLVSGATDSSEAYVQAVSQALSQAVTSTGGGTLTLPSPAAAGEGGSGGALTQPSPVAAGDGGNGGTLTQPSPVAAGDGGNGGTLTQPSPAAAGEGGNSLQGPGPRGTIYPGGGRRGRGFYNGE
jgi:uncharacterized protein with FMN-binding domain